MNIKVVGAGGISGHFLLALCLYLTTRSEEIKLVIIDGDDYEEKNKNHQFFTRLGNKAEVTVESLKSKFAPESFPQLTIEAEASFVTEENVFVFIREGDIVFTPVDNHKTRKLISDHVTTLANATLISGGNNLWDGDIQIFRRVNGQSLDPSLDEYHANIANPTDRNPADLSCEERSAVGQPQLICTNKMVASWMLSAFMILMEAGQGGGLQYNQLYVDLRTGKANGYLLARRQNLAEGGSSGATTNSEPS